MTNNIIPDEAVQAALDTWRDHEFDGTLDYPRMRNALTAALPFLSAQGAVSNTKIEAARKAVEELANTQMNLPLEDWSRISSVILSALEPSAARELALEEAARVCGAKIVSMQAHYDQTDNPFIRSNLAGDIALISHLADAIRALSSPAHADAGKVEGDGWLPIESAPTDETLFLAYCPSDEDFPDGRMMIWKGSIFAFQKNPTPNHLQFPATHWRPLPSAPASEGAE